ncbi:unnamed protein product [Amoebophrya sp. A120]|nr:unnamed protein product [Amoebophrya sp. A120]|eukprot:GSA120T00006297001.1
MGKGGGGKKGGGGYPWWQHIKSKGGGKQQDEEPDAKKPKLTHPQTELQKYCWNNLEGAGYGSYKDLKGEWAEDEFTVYVDHVQGDAYAPPSHVRVRIPAAVAKWPDAFLLDNFRKDKKTKVKNLAAADFVQRVVNDYLRGGSGVDWTEVAEKNAGWSSSKGGDIQVDRPSQFVLQRSCVVLMREYCEVRATLALPAHGRTAEGKKAAAAFDALVKTAQKALIFQNLDHAALRKHLQCVEDQQHLRAWCADNDLVAFVGDSAILPRKAGNDDRPMDRAKVVPFESPESSAFFVELPHRGKVRGMGIKKGVTLIVGGGFHGKSTLLQALQTGVYDKIPNDGRELVVTEENAFKLRSEDGRCVLNTDISPFIKNLPNTTANDSAKTTNFTTQDASGSTSQAANISEALEAGATCLLVDEDTCATNFMIRDKRMQMLVANNKEPIQPFIDKVVPLFETTRVSTILVVGASGDFFEKADTVLCLENYIAKDVTAEAKKIVTSTKFWDSTLDGRSEGSFPALRPRRLNNNTNCAADGKASARNLRCIQYGEEEVELTYVEQLVELSQAKALTDILQLLGDDYSNKVKKQIVDESSSFSQLLDKFDSLLAESPLALDVLSRWDRPQGFYAKPRKLEIACCINRLRTANFS